MTEVRDPRGATRNLQFVAPGQPMVPEWDAEAAIKWAYLANVFVYRCVEVIADAIGGLPFRAGPNAEDRTSHNTNARLAQLLGPPPLGPNPETPAAALWRHAVASRLVTGRFGWEIETRPRTGEVVALWPLAASSLRAIPAPGGNRYFAGFEYGPVHDPVRFTAEQVFYDWRPSLRDYRQPESVLQAARLDVSVAVMQDRYDHAFLRNDSRPAAVMVLEQFANDQQFEQFKHQFRSEHQGPDNAGGLAFIETSPDGAKPSEALIIETLGLSQKDTQAVERYSQKIRAITVAFGVPLSMLGDASGRTFDNADQEERNFWRGTIIPLLRDLEDAINLRLAPRVGPEVGWFDVTDVVALRPPRRFALEPASNLVAAQIVGRDEIRADYDLPPLGGDQFPNARLVDEVEVNDTGDTDQVADTDTTSEPTPAGDSGDAGDSQERSQALEVRGETPDERRSRIWRQTDATVRTMEARWERAWRRMFARQERSVLAALEGKRGHKLVTRSDPAELPDIESIFRRAFWGDETLDMTADLYDQVLSAGATRVSDLFGVSFDLEAPWAREFVQARANRLAGPVTDTTYQAIKDAMVDGVANGDGIPELAARIREVFADASSRRATVIARTEVISAFNGSASTAAAQLPASVVAAQEWIATRDGRTRDEHLAADGQIVPMGAPFDVGGEGLPYPGGGADPANNIQCRCTIAFLTPDEYAAHLGTPAAVPHAVARVALAMVREGDFDEHEFRRHLIGAAA